MPPQHRVRLYDHQGGTPLPPPFGEQDPKESIPPSELRAIEGARQRGQLLTEREVLERNRPVPTTRQHDRSKHHDDGHQHVAILSCIGSRYQPVRMAIGFWRTTCTHI